MALFWKTIDSIIQKIKYDRLVIIGDFNVNILEDSSQTKNFRSHVSSRGLDLISPYDQASTYYNTLIDLVISNKADGITAGYFENLISYHKPIWSIINIV